VMAPTALSGTSPKSKFGFRGGPGEIGKELDGALPCGDDMVRAERLQGSVFLQHSVCGMMKSAASPVNEVKRD